MSDNLDNENSRITISDVAEALGVSKTTVSRAISGKGRIGETTRKRVLEYISEHNYTPNVIAKSLAKSRTYNISWVLPDDYSLSDLPFFQNCLMGVSEVAASMEYDILVSMVRGNDVSQLRRAVTNHKIDGAILSRTVENDVAAEYLLSAGVPFVAIGSTDIKGVIQVDNDHKTACEELTSLLLLKGNKRLGLIGGNHTHMVTKYRLRGFTSAYEDSGEILNNEYIYLDTDTRVRVEKAVDELLEKGVDCIVSMDDSICTFVLNKLKKDNINVPHDVKVASFYNSLVLDNNVPSVTALNFDAVALGREACHTMLELIEGQSVEKRKLLGYDIFMKESTK